MSNLTYLQGYPEQLLSQVRTLINEQRLGDVLAKRYPGTHDYATDKALWQYTQDLKNQFLIFAALLAAEVFNMLHTGSFNRRKSEFPIGFPDHIHYIVSDFHFLR